MFEWLFGKKKDEDEPKLLTEHDIDKIEKIEVIKEDPVVTKKRVALQRIRDSIVAISKGTKTPDQLKVYQYTIEKNTKVLSDVGIVVPTKLEEINNLLKLIGRK